MGHLCQRGKAKTWYYVISVSDAASGTYKHRWVACPGDTKPQARIKMEEAEKAIRDGVYISDAKVTVATLMAKFLDTVRPGLAVRSQLKYEQIVDWYIVPEFGSTYLMALRTVDVQGWYSRLQSTGRVRGGGLSTSTVSLVHRIFKSALNYAVDWQYLHRNPLNRVKPPKVTSRRGKILSAPELRRVREALVDDPHLFLPFMLSLGTGMREGEVCGLRWQDVDLERWALRVEHSVTYIGQKTSIKCPKNGSSRIVFLPSHLVQLLEQQYESRTSEWVYPGEDGKEAHPARLCKRWYRTMHKLGIACTFHDLRHTHTSILMNLGMPLKAIADRIGDESSMTASTYTHTTDGAHDCVAEAVQSKIFEQCLQIVSK